MATLAYIKTTSGFKSSFIMTFHIIWWSFIISSFSRSSKLSITIQRIQMGLWKGEGIWLKIITRYVKWLSSPQATQSIGCSEFKWNMGCFQPNYLFFFFSFWEVRNPHLHNVLQLMNSKESWWVNVYCNKVLKSKCNWQTL